MPRGIAELRLRPVPGRVVAGARCRPRRQRHLVVGKTEVAIDLAQQGDEARDFALHILLAAEHMRVVLLEGARPHDAVERTGGLIAVAGAELGIADRKLSPRAQALVEDLHVARARHRFQRHRQFAVIDPEHVLAELVPVAAAAPKLLWQQLRRPDLGIAGAAHLAPEIVLQHPIDCVAARMPEHHAWRIFLKMPELELHTKISVVEIVHSCNPCEGKKRGRGTIKNRKGPVRRRRGLFWVKYACL